MSAWEKLVLLLLAAVVIVVGALHWGNSYCQWLDDAPVYTKTGICTGMVEYDKREAQCPWFLNAYVTIYHLRFEDGSEYCGRLDAEADEFPMQLTIQYITGDRWYGTMWVSAASPDKVYETYEEFMADYKSQLWEMPLTAGGMLLFCVLLGMIGPVSEVVTDLKIKRRRARKKAARKARLEAKRRKESEGLK